MTDTRLTFVPLQAVYRTDNWRYVACFDSVDTMIMVIRVRFVQHALIISCITACLVMPDDLHA